MNLDEQIEIFKSMTDSSKVEIFTGMDGWLKLVLKRTEIAKSPIKQIINAQMAAKYHAMVNGRIHEIIAQRALKGLEIKNLITFKDKDLEIEKSNASTLKETRYMPADFEFRGMTAIFGDYVTITNLNEDDNFGVIVHDALIARSFESMFDALWGMGTAV